MFSAFTLISFKNSYKLSDITVAFNLYDIWQTGYIEKEEVLRNFYIMLVLLHLKTL